MGPIFMAFSAVTPENCVSIRPRSGVLKALGDMATPMVKKEAYLSFSVPEAGTCAFSPSASKQRTIVVTKILFIVDSFIRLCQVEKNTA